MHSSLLNGVFWETEQIHNGIREIGPRGPALFGAYGHVYAVYKMLSIYDCDIWKEHEIKLLDI